MSLKYNNRAREQTSIRVNFMNSIHVSIIFYYSTTK